MTVEPVTRDQLNSLYRMIGPLAGVILGPVDLSRGRGVGEGVERFLWSPEGHRITVDLASDGGIICGRSKDIDPEAPPSGVFPT